MRATNAEAPCEISRPVLEQASQSSRALNCCRCVSRSPVCMPNPGLSRECEELSQHKLLAAKGFFSALPRFLLFPGNRGAQKYLEISQPWTAVIENVTGFAMACGTGLLARGVAAQRTPTPNPQLLVASHMWSRVDHACKISESKFTIVASGKCSALSVA